MSKIICLGFLTLFLVEITLTILPDNYQSLTAEVKQDILWKQVNKNVYPEDRLPTDGVSIFSLLGQLWPSKLSWAFTHKSDERTAGKNRIIHPYGSVATATVNFFANSSYTGIFRAGSAHPAIIRASIATVDKTNFIPGISLKVLLDGRPSANIVALNSLDGQGSDKNFFAKNFSTILPTPNSFQLKFLNKIFAYALTFLPGGSDQRPESPNNLPVYELAQIGEENADVIAPYMLTFVPNPANAWNPSDNTDFRTKLGQIPSATSLYTITACRRPGAPSEIIGSINSMSAFVASFYGDGGLFFQHPSRPWKTAS